MGKAQHVLKGDKPAEFHHARGPVRYKDDDLDPLQTKLQYSRPNEFNQNLGGLKPPKLVWDPCSRWYHCLRARWGSE